MADATNRKHLVALHDPRGFNYTTKGEPLRFSELVCHKPGCGCDRCFTGIASSKGATLGLIVDGEASGTPSAWQHSYFLALQHAIRDLPVGTVVRARYGWRPGEPGGQSDVRRWSLATEDSHG